MASVFVDLILMIVFLAIGIYTLTRSNLKSPQGMALLLVAAIFLILALVFAFGLAGISVFLIK